jgi:hypothetical protein
MLASTVFLGVEISNSRLDVPEKVTEVDQGVTMSFVSGTEYKPGQAGQVIVEARYANGTSAIDNDIIFVMGGASNILYDNASIDSITSFVPLWTAVYGACVWGGSSYSCGSFSTMPGHGLHDQSMERIIPGNTGAQLLGFKTDMSLSINGQCSGGQCFPAAAWIWVGDGNASINGYGSSEGFSLDLNYFTLYRNTGGNHTVIFDVPDPITCYSISCVGYSGTLSLYVMNGEIILERGAVELMRVSTDYIANNKTTYGIYGSVVGSPYTHQASVVGVDNVYDVINGTAIIPGVPCNASVWYPDKSLFIDRERMLLGTNGNGFIDFVVPSIDGVYEYQSICAVNNKNYVASKSFHVTKPRIYAVTPK